MYRTTVRTINYLTWLAVAYFAYVFLANIGITPYRVINEMHALATTLFVSVGF